MKNQRKISLIVFVSKQKVQFMKNTNSERKSLTITSLDNEAKNHKKLHEEIVDIFLETEHLEHCVRTFCLLIASVF